MEAGVAADVDQHRWNWLQRGKKRLLCRLFLFFDLPLGETEPTVDINGRALKVVG